MTVVLDSWAILRFLEDGEPAAGAVADLLDAERPLVSVVDLALVSSVLRRELKVEAARTTVQELRALVKCDVPDRRCLAQAAELVGTHGLPPAAALSAATAMLADATLWTGDPALLLEDAPWRWCDLRG